jgi:hypothetical protein
MRRELAPRDVELGHVLGATWCAPVLMSPSQMETTATPGCAVVGGVEGHAVDADLADSVSGREE